MGIFGGDITWPEKKREEQSLIIPKLFDSPAASVPATTPYAFFSASLVGALRKTAPQASRPPCVSLLVVTWERRGTQTAC